MLSDTPFDPAHYADPESQVALIADAFISGDVAFVVAALKAVLRAQDKPDDTLGLDPRLSVILSALDALDLDLIVEARRRHA